MINWIKIKEFCKKVCRGFIFIVFHIEIGNKEKLDEYTKIKNNEENNK